MSAYPGGSVRGAPLFNPANVTHVEDSNRAHAAGVPWGCPFRSVVTSFGSTPSDFSAKPGARCELSNGHDGPHQFPGEPEATADELAGIAWWNEQTPADRRIWLGRCGSARPADAWECYKAWAPTEHVVFNGRDAEILILREQRAADRRVIAENTDDLAPLRDYRAPISVRQADGEADADIFALGAGPTVAEIEATVNEIEMDPRRVAVRLIELERGADLTRAHLEAIERRMGVLR